MTRQNCYQCHKRVHATPMTQGAYNALRGWDCRPEPGRRGLPGHLQPGLQGRIRQLVPKAVFGTVTRKSRTSPLPGGAAHAAGAQGLGARVEALHAALYGGICKDFRREGAPESADDLMDAYLKALTAHVVEADRKRRTEEVL